MPVSLPPCCVQVLPERPKIQTAPTPAESWGPPTMAVLPSPERPTLLPCAGRPEPLLPTSLACWVHTPVLRVKIQAAPFWLLSAYPPTITVLPSPEMPTEVPCSTWEPTDPLPTSFACSSHELPKRAKT